MTFYSVEYSNDSKKSLQIPLQNPLQISFQISLHSTPRPHSKTPLY